MPSRLSRRLPSRAPEGRRVRTRSPRSRPSTASQSSAEGSRMRRACLSTPLPHARGLYPEGRRHHHGRNGLDRLSTGAPQRGSVAIADVRSSRSVTTRTSGATRAQRPNGSGRRRARPAGFTDGHTHFIDGGFQLASVNLRDAATPQEFVRRLKQYAKTLKPGDWISAATGNTLSGSVQRSRRHEWSIPSPRRTRYS